MSIKSPDFPPYLFCKKGKPKNFLYRKAKDKRQAKKPTFFEKKVSKETFLPKGKRQEIDKTLPKR